MEWSRRRGKFLGIYYNKAVRLIGEIKKVVQYDVGRNLLIEGSTSASSQELDRIKGAAAEFGLEGNYQFISAIKWSNVILERQIEVEFPDLGICS